MNVGTIKALCYLSSVGLLGGMVFVGYEHFTVDVKEMAEKQNDTRTLDILNSVNAPAPPKVVGLDYQGMVLPAIRDFDWTGAPPPPPKEIPDEQPDEDVEPEVIPVDSIVLVLAVLGDAEDESNSFALLEFKLDGAGGVPLESDYYYVGDSLPKPFDDVGVFAIRDGGVEFSFNDDERVREFLLPPTRISGGVIREYESEDEIIRRSSRISIESGSVASLTQRPEGGGVTEKRNGIFEVGRGDAQTFAQDYQRILSEDVRLETYRDPETGEKAGIKVSSVTPGSIGTRHGAEEGDIIKSINGDLVTSQQEAIQYVRDHSDSTDVWRVRYLRAGLEREEVYHSPDNN